MTASSRTAPRHLARRPGSFSPPSKPATVLRRIADGHLKAVKVGTHHRIPFGEYERFRDELFHRMAETIAPDVEAELFGD